MNSTFITQTDSRKNKNKENEKDKKNKNNSNKNNNNNNNNSKHGETMHSKISPIIVLGAGCFWRTRIMIRREFQKIFPKSIKLTRVGFMSPELNESPDPTYEGILSGGTGYVEVVYVELNDPAAHFEELIRFFFRSHDPTTKNRQGHDIGPYYSSFIFTSDEIQYRLAKNIAEELQIFLERLALVEPYLAENDALCPYLFHKIETRIVPMTTMYVAPRALQEWKKEKAEAIYSHVLRLKSWPEIKQKI